MTRAVHLSCTDATFHTLLGLQHQIGHKQLGAWAHGGGERGEGEEPIPKLDAGRQCARWSGCSGFPHAQAGCPSLVNNRVTALPMLHMPFWLLTTLPQGESNFSYCTKFLTVGPHVTLKIHAQSHATRQNSHQQPWPSH